MTETPGVDMVQVLLVRGLSAACGMALNAKLDGKSYHVYALLGDGEIEEGQIWEASMFAGAHKLDNLTVIVDNNGLQIDGRVGMFVMSIRLTRNSKRLILTSFASTDMILTR